MTMIVAAAPGLAFIGFLMLTLGMLGVMFAPVARADVWRVFATGLVLTLVGAGPLVTGGSLGAAHAAEKQPAPAMQQVLLSGMGSQIVFD